MKSRGITLKLVFLILTSISVIFAVVFTYNYFFSRRIISENVEKNARNLAQSTVNKIDTILLAIEKVPRNLSYFYEDTAHEGLELIDILRSFVKNNPEIYGAVIAFDPDKNKNSKTVPYVYRKNDSIGSKFVTYDFIYQDWYQIPKELNRPVWTEPYFGKSGNILMATYAMPFYKNINGRRVFMGVVAADISLSWLQDIISSIKIGKTGYGFLLSKNGTFVTHPIPNFVMNETIFSVAEAMGDLSIRELGRKMISGNSGFTPFTSIMTKKECWMVYTPLSSNGWSLAVLFPQVELMADISRLNNTVFFISMWGFFIILIVTVWIAKSITRPLRVLSMATEAIATGNLDIEIPPIKSRDEVGKLAESFTYMKTSLKKYIEDLTEATAARERIESELKVAHDIQMGILPKKFPPFPDKTEFDLYAALEPAKDVGGDLYDFFLLDDDHLCITVGDVSGKGVPAAIFMAITKTLIKSKATQGLFPEKIMKGVNEALSLDNPSLMFVTLFLGILDLKTGELEYCNGGHNPPYLINADGRLDALPTTNGMALGVMEDFEYLSNKIQMNTDDILFMYTDGVTEAVNKNDELFSDARLQEELKHQKGNSVRDTLEHIVDKVETFSQGVPQADDITILVLKYFGNHPNARGIPMRSENTAKGQSHVNPAKPGA